MSNSFSVFCLYADDVRQEVSNKLTYVGTYMGDLVANLPVVPGHIPRLVVSVFVTIPRDRDFQIANIELLWDEQIVQAAEVKNDDLPVPPTTVVFDEVRIINSLMVMEPMVLPGSGRFDVRVTLDEEVVMGNGLRVTVNTILQPDTRP